MMRIVIVGSRMLQSQALKIGCIALVLAAAALGAAQKPAIHVLLLNGNDGKPLPPGEAGSHYSLFIFPWCGKDRVCMFPDQRFAWNVDPSGRTDVPVFDKLQALKVTRPSSQLMYCQGSLNSAGRLDQDPTFSVDEILQRGVIAPNNCNSHLNLQPHPGELVFFLRPLTWWERLTKPPQM